MDVSHAKYEAKSARGGARYGDSCTWPSYFSFWLAPKDIKFG